MNQFFWTGTVAWLDMCPTGIQEVAGGGGGVGLGQSSGNTFLEIGHEFIVWPLE